MDRLKKLFIAAIPYLVVVGTALICAIFLLLGTKTEDGTYTLDGKPAQISESTKEWMESAEEAYNRIVNESQPTDEETIKKFASGFEVKGLGGSVTLEQVKARRLPDGDTDYGKGWQCSKYTAYLATGQREYSYAHPDYGPVNGKDVVDWLERNFGWKEIDSPVEGAIGSGGWNTLYGHTAEFLYWVSDGVAMVSDANYVPLTVDTHTMNVTGWRWAVPGDYTPDPTPTPTPTPTPKPDTVSYSYVPGDSFGRVLIKLGLDEGNLWGENGTVRYYTKQLVEQNVLDRRGNVLLYTPFTLKRRS